MAELVDALVDRLPHHRLDALDLLGHAHHAVTQVLLACLTCGLELPQPLVAGSIRLLEPTEPLIERPHEIAQLLECPTDRPALGDLAFNGIREEVLDTGLERALLV